MFNDSDASVHVGILVQSRMGAPTDYTSLLDLLIEDDRLSGKVMQLGGAIRLAPK